jgi:hypothetical protein
VCLAVSAQVRARDGRFVYGQDTEGPARGAEFVQPANVRAREEVDDVRHLGFQAVVHETLRRGRLGEAGPDRLVANLGPAFGPAADTVSRAGRTPDLR